MPAKRSRRATRRLDGEWIAIQPNLLSDRDARLLVRRAVRHLMSGGVAVPDPATARNLGDAAFGECVAGR
jgi:hypothetical protein